MSALTLLIPGLLSPVRDLADGELPSTPALGKLLSIAERRSFPQPSFCRRLCELFSLETGDNEDDPVAALTHAVDEESVDQAFWMRADPVHLAADREGVVLMDEAAFNLELQEALVLAAAVRELFAEEGMELFVPTTHRWYLKLAGPPGVTTTPVHEVVAKDIHRFMPQGTEKDRWARLLNAIQMTLYQNEVNREREQRSELPVNSLWCWGGGVMPVIEPGRWDRVFSDEVIARGFAQAQGLEAPDLPEEAAPVLAGQQAGCRTLIVLSFGYRHTQYHDLVGWQDFITYLESFWFPQLLDALRDGVIEELTLVTEDQRFYIRKSSLLKFWRQRKPLQTFL